MIGGWEAMVRDKENEDRDRIEGEKEKEVQLFDKIKKIVASELPEGTMWRESYSERIARKIVKDLWHIFK